MENSAFHGKRVFVTGHTGFKGAWLCMVLEQLGAEVTGYALAPAGEHSLFEIAGIASRVHSVIGDVRDFERLQAAYTAARPDVVIHMAAQPLVRESYKEPRFTYETNVMGTVNLLECLRLSSGPCSFLNVTTDKVYENNEQPDHAFAEEDKLDGFDPYSNSKSCSELVTHSYSKSFFGDRPVAISTARAGNVIGGGDFAADRIIPDCVRVAVGDQKEIALRNPHSTRPYQHVLEPLFAYLTIVQKQMENPALAGWYNVGPDRCDCVDTGQLTTLFCEAWGDGLCWVDQSSPDAPHEAGYLFLDNAKMKETFSWAPQWHIQTAIEKTVEWTRAWAGEEDIVALMQKQIKDYMENDDGT